MFWPRQICSKYVNKLEDLKYEENSVKAVQCLNDMVTYALLHAEDALKYMAALRDPSIFQFCAIQKIMAIGTLALCYNNIEVFRGVVKMRRVKINILCVLFFLNISLSLTAKIIDRTKTMSDVYGAFYDFSRMLKSKVNDNDPNARKTKDSLEVIPGICRYLQGSGTLNQRKSYYFLTLSRVNPKYNATLIVVLFVILAMLLAYLSASRPSNICKFYCGSCKRFLADRFVEGNCPFPGCAILEVILITMYRVCNILECKKQTICV